MKLSLVVGKEIQQAKKFPMNAPGRGDNRGEESATRILVGEHEIDVRMTQGAVQRRVSRVAIWLMLFM